MASIAASMAFGGVAKGLSPISSSMTSFPAAISVLATARTVNADSTSTDDANLLNAGITGGPSYRIGVAYFHATSIPSLCGECGDDWCGGGGGWRPAGDERPHRRRKKPGSARNDRGMRRRHYRRCRARD